MQAEISIFKKIINSLKINFASAYANYREESEKHPKYTNYTVNVIIIFLLFLALLILYFNQFKGTLDYILYNSDAKVTLSKLLEIPNDKDLSLETALPS